MGRVLAANAKACLAQVFRRATVATFIAIAVAMALLPMWTPNWFLYWQVPAVIFLFICYIGKLLIDTILYPPKK
jgi:hypothetical protein